MLWNIEIKILRKKPGDKAFRVLFKFPRRRWDQRPADFNRFSSVKTRGCYSCLVLYLHGARKETVDIEIHIQKQPSRGILKKRFTGEHPCRSATSINLQCNFIEIALQHGCSPVNVLHIFKTPFLRNTSGRLPLHITSGNDDRKIKRPISVMNGPATRMRKSDHFSQFKWTSTKVIPIEKT